MEILDEDMQMVRDALAESPEYVKEHFEHLLAHYHELEANKEDCAELQKQIEELESDVEDLEEQVSSLEAERDECAEAYLSVLNRVRYWLLDFLVHHRTTNSARDMLRIVEDVVR